MPFKTVIYQLWSKLKEDEFETDVIELLIERDPSLKDVLGDIEREQISQIYLFFDYDAQAYTKGNPNEIIDEMLETFNDETNHGKLYISYPMIEAIKDLRKNDSCYRRCHVPANINRVYKEFVNKDTQFPDFTNLRKKDWNKILINSIKKSNCIVSDVFIIPTYTQYLKTITPQSIFQGQLTKFIDSQKKVSVLGSFPFFIIDYFGETLYTALESK